MSRANWSLILMIGAMAMVSWMVLRFQPPDNRLLHTFRGHHGSVERLAVSPDGLFAFSASTGRDIRGHTNFRDFLIYDLAKKKEVAHYRFKPNDIRDLGFNKITSNLLIARNDPVAGGVETYLPSAAADGVLTNLKTVYRTPGRIVERFAISPDCRTLAVIESSVDARSNRVFWLTLVDTASRSPRNSLIYGAFRCISFSADSRTVFSDGSGKEVLVWNIRGDLVTNLGRFDGQILSIAASPDGSQLAVCRANAKRVMVTNKLMMKPAESIQLHSELLLWRLPDYSRGPARSDNGRSLTAAWLENGKTLAIGGLLQMDIIDAQTLSNRFHLRGHVGRIFITEDIPGTGRFISGGADGTLRLWSMRPLNKREQK